jgi:hypothetical protein
MEEEMAYKASSDKVYVGLKLPEKNFTLLDSYIKANGGSLSGYINEAVYDWLKSKGLEPEAFVDGRTGKWVVKREKA